jgi:SAM-dependent methyltransferase
MDRTEIQDRLGRYTFYHTIRLTDDLETPGWPACVPVVEKTLEALRGVDLRGRRVLDIGCRDGLVSFEAEKQGAGEVIGIDNDLSLAATEFLAPFFNSRVSFHEMSIYDLTPQTFGLFDVVVLSGVLYHLRYPFWGLKILRDVLQDGGELILETSILVDDNSRALLFCPTGKESPHEPTSCTFFNMKGLTDTLASLDLVVEKVDFLFHARPVSPQPPQSLSHRLRAAWRALRGVALPPSPPPVVIDRATLLVRKVAGSAPHAVRTYWDATHKLHTVDPNPIFAALAESH